MYCSLKSMFPLCHRLFNRLHWPPASCRYRGHGDSEVQLPNGRKPARDCVVPGEHPGELNVKPAACQLLSVSAPQHFSSCSQRVRVQISMFDRESLFGEKFMFKASGIILHKQWILYESRQTKSYIHHLHDHLMGLNLIWWFYLRCQINKY